MEQHWNEASFRHGMPVKGHGFNLFYERRRSTYPQEDLKLTHAFGVTGFPTCLVDYGDKQVLMHGYHPSDEDAGLIKVEPVDYSYFIAKAPLKSGMIFDPLTGVCSAPNNE